MGAGREVPLTYTKYRAGFCSKLWVCLILRQETGEGSLNRSILLSSYIQLVQTQQHNGYYRDRKYRFNSREVSTETEDWGKIFELKYRYISARIMRERLWWLSSLLYWQALCLHDKEKSGHIFSLSMTKSNILVINVANNLHNKHTWKDIFSLSMIHEKAN